MTHDIPPETLNSNINYCIDEYVRLIDHRELLRDHWFRGYTLDSLAAKYNVSTQTVKNIVYGIGDEVILRASKM